MPKRRPDNITPIRPPDGRLAWTDFVIVALVLIVGLGGFGFAFLELAACSKAGGVLVRRAFVGVDCVQPGQGESYDQH